MSGDDDIKGPLKGPWAATPSSADLAVAGLDRARAFLMARNFDAAIRDASNVLSEHPADRWGFRALAIIADVHMERDDYKQAYEIGHRMLELDPESADGFVQVGRAALELGNMRVAIDAIEAGLERDPDNISLMLLNSLRFHRCRDHDRAIAWASEAMAQAPNAPGPLKIYALAVSGAGRKDEAQQALSLAREQDPDGSHTTASLAIEAFNSHDFETARRHAVAALAQDPENATAHKILFRCRFYGNILMRPYWHLHGASTRRLFIYAGLLFAAMVALVPTGLGRIVMPAVMIYYVAVHIVVLAVEHFDRSGKATTKPTLKDY